MRTKTKSPSIIINSWSKPEEVWAPRPCLLLKTNLPLIKPRKLSVDFWPELKHALLLKKKKKRKRTLRMIPYTI